MTDRGLQLGMVEGRTVAIVGRAGSLATSGLGHEIDGADVVVRVNWTLPIPPDMAPHFGARTDVLYTMNVTRHFEQLMAKARLAGLELRGIAASGRLRHHLIHELAEEGRDDYTPLTGTMAVYDALHSGASEVGVYGFDFYSSQNQADTGESSTTIRERWEAERSAGRRAHDMDVDRALFRRWLEDEPRFVPDPVLADALTVAT